jgi:Centromere DNA-binding protein complex CBF3 subunit, domain 2
MPQPDHACHFGRIVQPKLQELAGVSEEETHLLGFWDQHYSSQFPIMSLKVANGHSKLSDDFSLDRELVPPDALLMIVFPVVERGRTQIATMPNDLGQDKKGAKNFLNFLEALRTIVLQDAACMIVNGHESPLFRIHPVFRHRLFLDYVESMRQHLVAIRMTPQPVHTRIEATHPGVGMELACQGRQQYQTLTLVNRMHAAVP